MFSIKNLQKPTLKRIIIFFQLKSQNGKKTALIKVLEETRSYDMPKGNFIKIFFAWATVIPVFLINKCNL